MGEGGIRGYLTEALRTASRSFDLAGRSTRSELLTYYFASLLIVIAITFSLGWFLDFEQERLATYGLKWLISVPFPALLVRRLHDQDRSGLWAWLTFPPAAFSAAADAASVFGGIEQRISFDRATWFFYWPSLLCLIAVLAAFLMPGTAGPNRFGPDPRGRE